MNDTQCLSHTKWDCKYHVVWIPKYRRKTLFCNYRLLTLNGNGLCHAHCVRRETQTFIETGAGIDER